MPEYDGLKTCTVHADYVGQQEPQQQTAGQTITPPAGSVTFTLTSRLNSSSLNKIYIPKAQKVALVAGQVSVRLFLNEDEDLDTEGTAYSVLEEIDNTKYSRTIRLTADMADTTVELADLPDAQPAETFEQFVGQGAFAALQAAVDEHMTNHPGAGEVSNLASVEYVDDQITGVFSSIEEHVQNDVADPHPNSRYAIMVDLPGRQLFTRDTDPLADPLIAVLHRELWFPESGA